MKMMIDLDNNGSVRGIITNVRTIACKNDYKKTAITVANTTSHKDADGNYKVQYIDLISKPYVDGKEPKFVKFAIEYASVRVYYAISAYTTGENESKEWHTDLVITGIEPLRKIVSENDNNSDDAQESVESESVESDVE